MQWRCGSRELVLGDRTLVMGIVNVTPDSFSDGGRFEDAEAAVQHGLRLVAAGADILDIGGESTRPGSDPVGPDEELARVLPVIEKLAAEVDVPISIDTRKASVARACVHAGASIVNDISAGADPEMFDAMRGGSTGIVLMHMKGEPKTMQDDPTYDDVVEEVHEFLRERVESAVFAGIEANRLCVDPGVGFGKSLEHTLELLRHLDAFEDLGVPLLVGPSRKRFIGTLTGADDPEDRVDGTAAAVAWCAMQRVDVVRVHDVERMTSVVRVIDAIVRGTS